MNDGDSLEQNRYRPSPGGFSLVELLIVVVILAILTSIAAPAYRRALFDTRETSLQTDLHLVRSQLGIYRQQHTSYPSMANLVSQMTMATDADGNTAPPGTAGFPFGPYLLHFPENPMTSTATIGSGAVGTSDWYYDESTGMFRANDSVPTSAY